MRCQVCIEKIEEQSNGKPNAGLCNKCRDELFKNLELKDE